MNIINTKTRVRGCGVQKNQFFALLIAILACFVTIGFDTMWLMQDTSPVMGQSMRPQQCAKKRLQQNSTNHHVIRDTASQGYALHRISPTITTTKTVVTLFIPSLYGKTNEPYGRVVHPAHDDTSKVNQDDSRLDTTNGPKVAALSSGGGGDDEEDPDKKKPNNDGCGGDKSFSGQNDNDEEDDEDREPGNAFIGEAVDVFGSNDPDDFSNITFDDGMDIDEDTMVEVDVVDETEEEDMVGLWEE